MSNYNETTTTGTKWTRCEALTIRNPLNATPEIFFMEEIVVNLDNTIFKQSAGTLALMFSPLKSFAILNPDTGEPTGEVTTQAKVYQILYSLYIQAAQERDAQLAVT